MAPIVSSQDVALKSFDGVTLSGVLELPPSHRAVVIMVHGSFVQTRDGDLDDSRTWMFPHGTPKRHIFRDASLALSTVGVGSLRFDKRASGKSGGIYEDTDLLTLSKDVCAWISYLHKVLPGTPIGILGQSEGTLTALKAAELCGPPEFLVLQGAALEPIQVWLEYQRSRAAKPFLSDKTGKLSADYPYIAAFYHAAYSGDLLKQIHSGTSKYYNLHFGKFHCRTSLKKYQQWQWSGLDMLRKLKTPTLVMIGERDLNVRPEAGRFIEERQKINEYKNVEVKIFSGLDHSFRETDDTDNFVTAMAKPLSPRYAETLTQFVSRTLSL